MTLTPGTIGIDYAFARPSLAEAKKAGAGFVLRYSAGAATSPAHQSHDAVSGKLITPAEFKAILAAGLDVIANDEWYETRVTEGAGAGRQDAAAAMALWRSCGLNRGASIYVSWDTVPATSKWPAVDDYLAAYQAILGSYYHVDIYAGTPYLQHAKAKGLIRYGWRPNAGSWSNDGLPYQPDTSAGKRAALAAGALDNTPAHLWQTGNYWFNKNADENLILRSPVGSHGEAAAVPTPVPAPTPAPAGKPTPAVPSHYYKADGHGAVAAVSPGGDYALVVLDDGRVEVRKYDPAKGHGAHVRYL